VVPSAQVLDLFAVPGLLAPLPGGQDAQDGQSDSVLAGDLVLTPGREPAVQAWLSPLLARLAVSLDEEPGRTRRDLRVAVPVPARDGAWVVEGWAASRWEPGTTACDDLAVTLAAGRLLHARLATLVEVAPTIVLGRDDRGARAERLAFGPVGDAADAARGTTAEAVVDALCAGLAGAEPADLGPAQLVHSDLTGHVLLDAAGAPVVLDVSPAWRPVRWAEAVATLDAVVRQGADAAVLGTWTTAADRQALRRAALFRVLADADPGAPAATAYAELLASSALT